MRATTKSETSTNTAKDTSSNNNQAAKLAERVSMSIDSSKGIDPTKNTSIPMINSMINSDSSLQHTFKNVLNLRTDHCI